MWFKGYITDSFHLLDEFLSVAIFLSQNFRHFQLGTKHASKEAHFSFFSLFSRLLIFLCCLSGLKAFLHCVCNLERLDVSWCQEVTDQGVQTVLEGCPYLKHLGELSIIELKIYHRTYTGRCCLYVCIFGGRITWWMTTLRISA